MSQSTAASTIALNAILHPTDFTAASEVAFAHALKLALEAKAKLYIVHTEPRPPEAVDWDAFPGVRRMLARWGLLDADAAPAAVAEQHGIAIRKLDVFDRDPARGILHFMERHPADLIVLATHGRDGTRRWFHRPVAEPLARQARLPALFLPHDASGFVDPASGGVTLSQVLAPVDHSPRPEAAIAMARGLAAILKVPEPRLRTLYVGAPGDAPTVGAEGTARVAPIIRQGAVVDAIVDAAQDLGAELIAMATAGHQGFLDALRGSTTEQVLRRSTRAVLAVPAD
jgi:nucleotide-binding universal stress UspA family protein